MFALHRARFALRLATLTVVAGAAAAGALALFGPVQASADDLGPFTCTDKSGGVAPGPGDISGRAIFDIRVAHHNGYDRLVFDFPGNAVLPQYQLTRQGSSSFVRDPSGLRSILEGSAGIRAVFQNTELATGVPNDLKPRLPEIREIANIGNFERVVSYGVGLKTAACFRVLELSGPTRLVIDVQTPPDAVASASAATTQPAPSTAATPTTVPSDLAATGRPASAGQPAGMPIAPILLGLLAVTAGLTIAGLRRFASK
ncbi:MAG: hypothetical protein E6I68_09255 [Chloroflexi bacterium]|nr:MAG: hypothetical protein E6I68_09255 [Chloroflexota bacterium]